MEKHTTDTHARSFEIGDEHFLLDGEPFRILSGAIHYFRVHPEQWADRIRKARLMGLNTIETYVAWNAHEPVRGRWDEVRLLGGSPGVRWMGAGTSRLTDARAAAAGRSHP